MNPNNLGLNFEKKISGNTKILPQVKTVALEYLQNQKASLTVKEYNSLAQRIADILETQNIGEQELLKIFEAEKEKVKIDSIIFRNEIKLNSIIDSFNFIQTEKDENTGIINLGIDKVVGAFGGETGEQNYEYYFKMTQKNLQDYINSLTQDLKSIDSKIQSNNYIRDNNQIEKLQNILNSLKKQQQFKLETKELEYIFNSFKSYDVALDYGYHGAKGMVDGIWESILSTIEGVGDFLTFIGRYGYSFLDGNSKYREEVYNQISQIWDVIKELDKEVVFKIIKTEFDKISTLPSEKQAEAIGNLAGNIIGQLIALKIITKTPKVLKSLKGVKKVKLPNIKPYILSLNQKIINFAKAKSLLISMNSLRTFKTNYLTVEALKTGVMNILKAPIKLTGKTLKASPKLTGVILVLGSSNTLVYAKDVNGEVVLETENGERKLSDQELKELLGTNGGKAEIIIPEENLDNYANGQGLGYEGEVPYNLEGGSDTDPEENLIRNPISNKNILKSSLGNYFSNIEDPKIRDLLTILDNPTLRKQKGIVFNYALQSALSILGFGEKLGSIDGIYGSKTMEAVRDFQEKYSLKVDGKVGQTTVSQIIAILGQKDNSV